MIEPVVIGDATLYLGDALAIMQMLDDNSVDLIATDPPYLNLVGGYDLADLDSPSHVGISHNKMLTVGDEWTATLDWITETKRIARLGAMIFCTHHSIMELAQAFVDWRRVMLLTWYKRNAPPTGKNVPHFTCEYIWCFAKEPGLHWDVFKSTMIDMPQLSTGCMASVERVTIGPTKQAVHPTQKPVKLMELLLTVGGNTVLDPFMGLGTTGCATISTGQQFVGIEISQEYFDISCRRIREAQQQLRLSL